MATPIIIGGVSSVNTNDQKFKNAYYNTFLNKKWIDSRDLALISDNLDLLRVKYESNTPTSSIKQGTNLREFYQNVVSEATFQIRDLKSCSNYLSIVDVSKAVKLKDQNVETDPEELGPIPFTFVSSNIQTRRINGYKNVPKFNDTRIKSIIDGHFLGMVHESLPVSGSIKGFIRLKVAYVLDKPVWPHVNLTELNVTIFYNSQTGNYMNIGAYVIMDTYTKQVIISPLVGIINRDYISLNLGEEWFETPGIVITKYALKYGDFILFVTEISVKEYNITMLSSFGLELTLTGVPDNDTTHNELYLMKLFFQGFTHKFLEVVELVTNSILKFDLAIRRLRSDAMESFLTGNGSSVQTDEILHNSLTLQKQVQGGKTFKKQSGYGRGKIINNANNVEITTLESDLSYNTAVQKEEQFLSFSESEEDVDMTLFGNEGSFTQETNKLIKTIQSDDFVPSTPSSTFSTSTTTTTTTGGFVFTKSVQSLKSGSIDEHL